MQFVHFLLFDEAKWILYILSHVHDEFIWFDRPHKITKKVIQVVIGLAEIGKVPSLRKVSNDTVIATTSSKFDSRSMTINNILENDVKFASMVVDYKVYEQAGITLSLVLPFTLHIQCSRMTKGMTCVQPS